MTQPSAHDSADPARPTVHERIGAEPIGRFAELLYARIDRDPSIRGMFSADLGPDSGAVRDMRQFLIQFFGGASDYSSRKGHPRLRARHMGFPITVDARAVWLSHALAALAQTADEYAIDDVTHAEMREYFERASAFMINR
jgi:hemoglobin